MALRYKGRQKVKGGTLERTKRRVAAVRLENPLALKGVSAKGGYSGREARRAKKAANLLPKPKKTPKKPVDPATKFDPLAPLTGKAFAEELGAAEQLRYGDTERKLRQDEADQRQTTANTGTYYDDYRQALREATARVNETNRVNVEEQAKRVDQAYQDESSRSAGRDAELSAQAAKLGRGPVTTAEGQQAAEGARSQGIQGVGRLREQASADTSLMEKRGATSVLAKAEALQRENARQRKLAEEGRDLEKDKGAFRIDERRKARESEREYEAIKKEFGLEKRKVDIDAKQGRADRALERQKINAQKIVARIYASADKAGARAQVRVAQLQLKKGKISKHQYQTIKNIYEGLPGGGSAQHPNAGTKGGKSGGGQWGGPVDTPPERQKSDQMFSDLMKRKPPLSARTKVIQGAIRNGVPRAAAVKAWRKYTHRVHPHRGSATPRNPDGTPG